MSVQTSLRPWLERTLELRDRIVQQLREWCHLLADHAPKTEGGQFGLIGLALLLVALALGRRKR